MADSLDQSPGLLADQSALIVVARLLDQRDSDDHTAATLAVHEVLKGDAPSDTLTVLLPPRARPGGLRASTDFALPDGAEGLWYLLPTDRPDRFRINSPARFVPMASAAPAIEALRRP